ncbi:MAG: FkbM family methyltransferase [Bacteroidota bacterium]|nr:FkbM family methyltransferase [Bacteroidota bacterium]
MIKSVLKGLYGLIPLKKEIYSALKIIWQPSEPIYRHLHFKGNIKVKVDDHRSFQMVHHGFWVENEIFWSGLNGKWEKDSLSLWIKLCPYADVIFDIGANTGIYSLVAKTIKPSARVFAFEPIERVCEKLKQNIKLNNFDIVPVQKAASDADGTAIIRDMNTEHIYSVTVNAKKEEGDGRDVETVIQITKLDTFIRENNITKVDLLKIDVETHEPEVMEGFKEFLFRFRPAILIEILNTEVGDRINKVMEGSGYWYYNINEQGGVKKSDKITQSDFYNFLLCTPEMARKIGLN